MIPIRELTTYDGGMGKVLYPIAVDELRKLYGDDGMIAPLATADYTRPNLVIRKCTQAQPALERTRSWPSFLNDLR